MIRRLFFLFCFILTASLVASYDFPAPGGKITSSFGSMGKGQFCTGIEIQTGDVLASEDGEVLFLGDDFIALAHEDSILTLYSDVEASDMLSRNIYVKKGQNIGRTRAGTLAFAVYDLEMQQYINPLLMTETVKKSELPKIKGISFDGDQDSLSVYVDDKGFTGLYRIQVSVDGKVVSTLGFRTIKRSGDDLVLDAGSFEYGKLYGRQGAFTFSGIGLKQGNNNVDIIVEDFYGKKAVFHGRITV